MAGPTADIRITANAAQANRELEGFAGRVTAVSAAVSSSMGGIRTAVAGLHTHFAALAVLISGGAMVAGVKGQIDMMDASLDAAQAAGVTVQAYRELGYAAQLSGSDQETLSKALNRLAGQIVRAADGDEKLRALFTDTLGVKLRDSTGAVRNADEVLEDLADRFATLGDGPRATALAIEVFGQKMGPGLVPFLVQGRAGIVELREEFRRLNGTVSQESAEAAAAFNDNMDRFKTAAAGFATQVAMKILPSLVDISTFAAKAAEDVGVLQAAWLTFGKVAARITGTDELGQARSELARAIGHTKLLQREIAELEKHAERQPGNGDLRAELDALRAKLGEVQTKAETTRAAIKKLEQGDPVPPPAKPKGDPTSPELTIPQADTRMQAWEAGLARERAAYARHQEQIGGVRELGKAEEAAYWKSILDTLKAGDSQRTAVELRYLGLQTELRKQRFEGEQAALRNEIDLHRGHYVEQAQLAAEYVEQARQRYGQDSREYQQALKLKADLARANNAQLDQLQAQRAQAQAAVLMAEVDDQQRAAELRYQLGLITEEQLLGIRGQAIERRRDIELQARQAELDAMQGNPNADPVALERLQLELDAIRRRYKSLGADNQADQQLGAGRQMASPFESVFGVSEQVLTEGLNSVVERGKITLGGLRDAARQIGGALLTELVTKPIAAWIVGQARMVVMTWLFGKQKVAAEAVTQGQINATQAAGSIKTIAMRAYEAAAGAYSAIAAIPYVGPVLAPIAAGVALGGVMAFAKRIFSAEGGFDIPGGVNPIVQTHAREMILPAKHADTIRMMGDLLANGAMPAAGGVGTLNVEGMRLRDGYLITTEEGLLKAFQRAQRLGRI